MIASKAISAISKGTGTPVGTLNEIARSLRSVNMDYWLFPQKGGGKNAPHTQLRHLAAMAIALGIGNVRRAGEMVKQVASLPANDPGGMSRSDFELDLGFEPTFPWIRDDFPELSTSLIRVAKQPNCLDAIAALIDVIAGDKIYSSVYYDRDSDKSDVRFPAIDVRFFINSIVGLNVISVVDDWHNRKSSRIFSFAPDIPSEEFDRRIKEWRGAILEARTLTASFLLVLASCWRDTQRQRKADPVSSSSTPVPGSADRQDKESPAPGRAGLSTSEHPGDDLHPTIYQNGFRQRSDGKSHGLGESRGVRFRPFTLAERFHDADHQQLAYA